MRRKAHYEMDMTTGPLLGKILRFALPLIFTGVLQLFYNAADVVVVGRFASSTALAAVSSTGSLINLIVNVFMGLSLGASVSVAKAYGAGDHKEVSDTVHTTIAMAIVCGVVVSIIGMCFGKPLLRLMDTPEEVLELSGLYVTIYFAGSLFNMVYNFGAAILRAVGDTRRPMYYLILSGLVNVVLNFVFVVFFHMSVAGVALATVISQIVSAVLVVICLMRTHSSIRLEPRKLRIVKDKALTLIKVGLPAGFQGAVFSISNVLIQSSINSFGADAMAGNGAAANIEGFVYVAMTAFYTAALTFTSQNLGARKTERLGRIMLVCQCCVFVTGLTLGSIVKLFSPQLLSIYSPDWNVIQMGMKRNDIITITYFLAGMMDVFVGGLRGMGNSFVPMIISLLGACVFRVVWIFTVFAAYRSLTVLYISYPISWLLTGTVQCICYLIVKKRMTQKIKAEDALMTA
ncbi:MAG: MATE family efflux transporter [Clostridia bacterium]|nr:MATE family efflux transporter [Clostridia bacterium]